MSSQNSFFEDAFDLWLVTIIYMLEQSKMYLGPNLELIVSHQTFSLSADMFAFNLATYFNEIQLSL